MKFWSLAALALSVALGTVPADAFAKRLGSGGMQRSLPSRSAADTPPARPAQTPQQPPHQQAPQQAAQPAQVPPAAAAAAGKRSWLGPIAGLAAGIGLAALFSHLGMGEAVANFVMLLLLGLAAVALIGWLLRRRGASGPAASMGRAGPEPAWAGATTGTGAATAASGAASSADRAYRTANAASIDGAAPGSAAASFSGAAGGRPLSTPMASVVLPPDFDRAGFERTAKLIFIRMQAANDRCDLNDLRSFTTPEMFASIRLDLQNRGDSNQQTDVIQVDAEVIDMVRDGDRDIVSVRYHGMLREDPSHPPTPFDEVWHLARPSDGHGNWAIAGIQATQ